MIKAVRGTRDIFSDESEKLFYIYNTAREVCGLYGYNEILTPVFERAELFERGIGEATDIISREMYVFKDRKERLLALRPENTAGVVRALVENKIFQREPVSRWLYFGPMFRYERPQTGRYRQFWQFGAEAFGVSSPDIDIEIIDVATRFLEVIGVKDYTLLLNNIGCPECRPPFRKAVYDYFFPLKDKICPNCLTRLETNPLRILDCKEENCQPLIAGSPVPKKFLCQGCGKHDNDLLKLVELYKIPFLYNERLVRGLDYYTKTVFEIEGKRSGAQNALLAGGRYDNLVSGLSGPDVPAIGFAAGVERLMLEMTEASSLDKPPLFYAAWIGTGAKETCRMLVRELRNNHQKIYWSLTEKSIRSQLRHASRIGADIVFIIGEDELKKNTVTLKFMKDERGDISIPLEEVYGYCREYSKDKDQSVS